MGTAPRLSERQFRTWRALLERGTGLRLPEARRPQLETLGAERAAATGCAGFAEYLYRLVHRPSFGRREWQLLAARLAVHETRFFRHPAVFAAMGRHLAERLRAGQQRLSLWSAGTASGEEAYSLAILAARLAVGRPEPLEFLVVGTDIDGEALARAAAGVYREPLRRGLEAADLAAFFEPAGAGAWRVRESLRRRVRFLRHDLLEEASGALLPAMDLISCQNVLVHLTPWRRRVAARRLAERLKPGGLLVFSPGDLGGWRPEGLQRMPDLPAAFRRPMGQ